MDIQRALISKTLADHALIKLIDQGIKEDFFPTQEHTDAYRWMLEYYREYGEVPTARGFKQNFPAYKLVRVDEPLEFLLDELRTQRKYALVDEVLFTATEIRKDGASPDEIVDLYALAVTNIHTEVTELRDVNLQQNWQERLDRYEELENLPEGMRGITLGFPSIDDVTSGAQDGQLITMIGEPKVGKSTMVLRMAISAHEAGKSVLFVGFEMSNEEQGARHDSMRARISHERLIRGKLRDKEKDKLRKALKAGAKKYKKPFVLSQDVFSATTLSGLQAKVQQYSPDIVFVDGVYMMDDEAGEDKGSSQHLTNITRGLKRMAQQLDIPVVITTQVLTWKLRKREGRKLTGDSIGYSSSFAQDSDLILGVEHTEKDDEKRVRIVLSRNSARVEISIRWDWNFGEFEEFGEAVKQGSFDKDDDEEEDAGDTSDL